MNGRDGRPSASRAGAVIVGGGIMGCSIAYHLLASGYRDRVVVIERDPSYRFASTRLAFGGIRQQFCSAVNVALARRSVELYLRFDEDMSVDGRPAAAKLRQRGYLFLADAAGADRLGRRLAKMKVAGAAVEKLSVPELARLVPDLEVSDLAFGLFGPQDGYADAVSILASFRAKAESLGAELLADEVESVSVTGGRIRGLSLRCAGLLETEVLVCAAGARAAELGRLIGGLELPVRPVRQQLVRAELPRPWPYEFPVVIDPTGVHWRSTEGNAIIVACTERDEPEGVNFAPDPDRFERKLLPVLSRRVPAFAGLRQTAVWAGLYEMTPDHNPLIGAHPEVAGLHLVCGFSGHGVMMAPASGEVVAAMLAGRAASIDVSALSPGRFRTGQLLHDEALI